MAQRLAHGLHTPFIGSSSLPSATERIMFASSRNGGKEDAPRPERGGETHVGSTPTFGTDNYAVVAERKTHRFERAAPARAYWFNPSPRHWLRLIRLEDQDGRLSISRPGFEFLMSHLCTCSSTVRARVLHTRCFACAASAGPNPSRCTFAEIAQLEAAPA